MTAYAIGDIQGCYDDLQRLLERLDFDPARDRLWFAGDLVNRGPASLETLRFVRGLGDAAAVVLGNHDLHLLAVAEGHRKYRSDSDTLDAILAAPDRDELLDWLRTRELLHRDDELGFAMVHAGLPPEWDLDLAEACAREVEAALGGDDYPRFLRHMYGNDPARWSPGLGGDDRLRFTVNCLTRLRYVQADGRLAFGAKGRPGSQPAGCMPWFEHPQRRSRDARIVFGHWSTLGLHMGDGVYGLDTGCLWGGQLTALRLDGDPAPVSIDCPGAAKPGRA